MSPRHGGAGFALILAIFLLVTLTAIGAYLLTVSTSQTAAGIQDEQGARAYQAARTGVEWGAYQLLRNTGGGFATGCAAAAAPATHDRTLTLAGAALTGYFAQISCSRVGSETEGTVTVNVYRITSTGCNQASGAAGSEVCGTSIGPTYVERQLQMTITD